MRITALSITNFKRIRDIAIRPDVDRTLILLGGRNAQGKSSVLDALTAAFGGKRSQPLDPVRHGTEQAEINVELDGGELSIKRVIQPGGESVIEVRDRFGAVKAPQAVLDKLVAGRFLDPLSFLQLPAKEQRATLMKLIEGAGRIAGLNEKRQRAFDRRTEVGRDLKKAEGELARLPEPKLESPIDVAALMAEGKQLDEARRVADALRRTHEQCQRETDQAKATLASINSQRAKIEAEIERLKAEVVALGIKSAEWSQDVETCATTEAAARAKVEEADAQLEAHAPRREQLDAELARADAHNRAVYAAEAQAKRRNDAEAEVTKLRKEVEDLAAMLAKIDERKAEILSAAKLPVPGLGVTDDGIELDGVPFAQASDAEQWRVALALAIAGSPDLDDVWIRDGALLDDESLELVAKQALAAGKRPWIERVSDRDPGVIVIDDGTVKEVRP